MSIKNILPLLLVIMIDMLGVGLIFPIISPLFMETQFGILPENASLISRNVLFSITMGIFSFFLLFGAPFCGDLSDRIGRKKTLLLCLLGTALGFFLCGLGIIYKSVTILLMGRALTGFAGGSQSLAQASMADISSHDKKTTYLSLTPMVASIGFVIGPMLGGYFSQGLLSQWFGFATPFFVASILAILNSIYLIYSFKETFQPNLQAKFSLTKGITIFTDAFKHKEILAVLSIFLCMQLAWGLYIQYVSLFLAQQYAFDSNKLAYFLSYLAVLFGFSLLVILPICLRYFSAKALTLWSLILMSIGLLGMALIQSEWAQWFFVIPGSVGASMGYALLLTLASDVVDKDSQGWAMGVMGAAFAMAWLLSGFACGAIAYIQPYLPFVLATVLGVLSIWIFLQSKKI